MTEHDFHTYWKPVRDAPFVCKWTNTDLQYDGTLERSQYLVRLLGLQEGGQYRPCGWMQISLTPELKDVLIKLAGPHGYAVAKALEARNEKSYQG